MTLREQFEKETGINIVKQQDTFIGVYARWLEAKQESPWIILEDYFPPEHENVLCLIDGDPPEVLAWSGEFWLDTDYEEFRNEVVAWMPIPGPPKE